MTIDDLQEILRRYLSTGVAVVVIVTAPTSANSTATGAAPPDRSEFTVVQEDGSRAADPGDRVGASGRDPEEDGEVESRHRQDSDIERRPHRRGDGADGGGTGSGLTAAERHGWGAPDRVDDFTGGTEQWTVYDGPGHAGRGTRSPSAVTVEDGVLTITGDSTGTTAGMAWNPGQKYGRWEGRVKAPASDPSYNALLLLWPDAEDFPSGGEIDFMEMMDQARQRTDLFVHHGADNSQLNGHVEVDATTWHNWAVEWTPDAITAYLDGRQWYRTTDTAVLPPGPMHLCIQLDWFPKGGAPRPSILQVDWVKQYALG